MKWLPKRRLWRVLIYVGVAAFALVLLTFWIGTAIMYQKQKRMAAAIRSAERVTLEEYRGHETLTLREIAPAKRSQIIDALPFYVIFPMSLKLCFVPHHRITAATPNVSTNTLLVCFGCDQGKFVNSSALFDLPPEWSRNLRQLFQQNGVPIRDEY